MRMEKVCWQFLLDPALFTVYAEQFSEYPSSKSQKISILTSVTIFDLKFICKAIANMI